MICSLASAFLIFRLLMNYRDYVNFLRQQELQTRDRNLILLHIQTLLESPLAPSYDTLRSPKPFTINIFFVLVYCALWHNVPSFSEYCLSPTEFLYD